MQVVIYSAHLLYPLHISHSNSWSIKEATATKTHGTRKYTESRSCSKLLFWICGRKWFKPNVIVPLPLADSISHLTLSHAHATPHTYGIHGSILSTSCSVACIDHSCSCLFEEYGEIHWPPAEPHMGLHMWTHSHVCVQTAGPAGLL